MEDKNKVITNENKEKEQDQIKVKHTPDNDNNVKHQQVDLDRLNKNKDNDPITQRLIKEDKMLLFITLTQRCNLNCGYCGNGSNEDIEDLATHNPEVVYDVNLIKKFDKVKDLAVCFYGGEPLLRIHLIEQIMPLLPNAKFCLQTNGVLLKSLKPEIVRNFNTILVSIDGDEATTDFNRGKGLYKMLIKHCKW